MCKCNPKISTPFCGRDDCEWPERPAPSDLKIQSQVIISLPDTMETLCQHIAAGGNLVDLCRIWHAAYWHVMSWISADPDRQKKYRTARDAHSEWCEDMVLTELKKIAFVDIRRAYDDSGSLLAMTDIPDDVAPAIASLEVDDIFAGSGKDREKIGETKKLKLNSKLDALRMLGEFRGMWKQLHQHDVSKTLEDLIVGSNQTEDKT